MDLGGFSPEIDGGDNGVYDYEDSDEEDLPDAEAPAAVLRKAFSIKGLKALNGVYSFRRSYSLGYFVGGGSTQTNSSYSFRLSNCPGYTELTNLFNFYTVSKVVITCLPDMTASNSSNTLNGSAPVFLVTSFYDQSALPPSSILANASRDNHRVRNFCVPFKETLVPSYLDATNTPRKGWINTSSPSTVWYGWWISSQAGVTAASFSLWLDVTLYIDCKDPK